VQSLEQLVTVPRVIADSCSACTLPCGDDALTGVVIVDIAAGLEFSLAVDENGQLRSWGRALDPNPYVE
jgi:alpha-tubulin suppressor-like RCC1 family protein